MIEDIINGIRDRIDFYPFREGLKSIELNAGAGWDGTADRLLLDRDASEDKDEFDRVLSRYVQDIVFCSKKSFTFFPYASEDLTKISASIAGLHNEFEPDNVENILQKSLDMATEEPTFAFTLDSSTIVLVSKRKQEYRVDIPVSNQLVKEFLDAQKLNSSSKLVAFDTAERLCFDFARVCHGNKTLEIAVDYGSEMRPADRLKVESELYAKVSGMLGVDLPSPLNIYDTINNMYELPSGSGYKIVELGFLTDDDYSHRVSGRGRLDPRDVREDAYHIAGSQDEEITPYHIAIQIAVGEYKRAELMLKSSASMVQSSKVSKLTNAFVLNCFNYEQLDQCLSYIYSSIKSECVEPTAA